MLALSRLGLPVPAWVCVTADAFEATGGDGLAPGDEEELLRRMDELFPRGAFVAIRSSAVGEDSVKDSFAGQLETYLWVPRESVLDRVRDAFASARSARANLYREARGRREAGAAVVVQLMVDARVAGVLFTANPTNGDRSEAVVTAGLGLGEGVVADRVETDTWFAELATGEIHERVVNLKWSRVVFDRERGTGTVVVPVPEEERSLPTLSDGEVRELVAIGRRIAEAFGGPQDIEWAIDAAGRIHVLQARPITTLERETVFDNSNIVESYPGLSLPLTFSFARTVYEATFRGSSRALGVPERVLEENRSVHANLVALVDGRIYYNILNWYRLFHLVPGFDRMLPAWERALGLQRRHVRRPPVPSVSARLGRLPVQLGAALRMVCHVALLNRSVRRFRENFAAVQEEFSRRDPDSLEAHELLDRYDFLARRLLGSWSITIVNDAIAQQAYAGVGKLAERWRLGGPTGLVNDLLCGEKGMESVEPVRSALSLAGMIRADPRLRAVFESGRDEAEVFREVRGEPAFAEFREALDRHLRLYGDRTVQELKLETPGAGENPAFLVSMLRNYLRGGQDVARMEERERAIRTAAEQRVRAALRWRPLRRLVFAWVLARCRRSVKFREDMRLARSRAFGMVKRIFRALGGILASKKLLSEPFDVFYLTVDEVMGAVRGHSATRDLAALVTLRKREYEEFARRSPAPRIATHGVALAHPFPQVAGAAAATGDELRGMGASPGRARGVAKVVLAPAGGLDVSGEILVAPMTDPGWVFLMVAAGGLVVEKGSLLSHTAIIGRELGVPTVVGVPDATRRIADGDTIEIDGLAGTVRILERRQTSDRP